MENLIGKVILGRQVVEAYRLHKTTTHDLESDLQALGFSSITDFFNHNQLANWQELVRCYTWEGTCDLCRGRMRGCCDDALTDLSWDTTFSLDKISFDMVSTLAKAKQNINKATSKDIDILNDRSNPYLVFFSWNGYKDHVPPNCAYRLIQLSQPALDIYWEMYHRDKTEYKGRDHELRRE